MADASVAVLETLRLRGWNFADSDEVKAVIMIGSALADDPSSVVDSVESELINMDLRSIGGKSLSEPALLRKSSRILGPIVLQISSVKDISRSSLDGILKASNGRRLLRFGLTDGHSELTAIEYSHIPFIPDDIPPGTKFDRWRSSIPLVLGRPSSTDGEAAFHLFLDAPFSLRGAGPIGVSVLAIVQEASQGSLVIHLIDPLMKIRLENKAPVHSGIACLGPKGLSVLGGVVPTLYEEWKMNQKYSGLSRASIRLSQGGDIDGPPPFEKLQVGVPSQKLGRKGKFSYQQESSSKSNRPSADSGNVEGKSTIQQQSTDVKATNSVNSVSHLEKAEEKPSSSETRPKEVVEAVPVQNQAASQKLLYKMSRPSGNRPPFKNRNHRGKGRMEDQEVYTLEEYERRKSGTSQLPKETSSYTNHDEELARQLQNKFDLEDFHVQDSTSRTNVEDIRMSMFNFERDTYTPHGSGRGRGGGGRGRRGRGRGWGRGRHY